MAQDIRSIVEPQTYTDPELKSARRYTNLSAAEVRSALIVTKGDREEDLPKERTMRDIGTMWHEGRIPVTTEHFASAYVQGRLRGLLSAVPNTPDGAAVLVACAPRETHELGALTLAVLLRRAGFYVYYLGPDLPLKDLRELALTLRPAAVMISASVGGPVEALLEQKAHLVGIAPVLAFGGAAFNARPALADALYGTFLAPDAKGAVRRFSRLVQQAGALHA